MKGIFERIVEFWASDARPVVLKVGLMCASLIILILFVFADTDTDDILSEAEKCQMLELNTPDRDYISELAATDDGRHDLRFTDDEPMEGVFEDCATASGKSLMDTCEGKGEMDMSYIRTEGAGDCSASDSEIELPFFLDPYEVFSWVGEIVQLTGQAFGEGDVEKIALSCISLAMWGALALFVVLVWVILPLCPLFLILRLTVAVLRLLVRLMPDNWRLYVPGLRGGVRAEVAELRSALESLRGDASRIPMKGFSEEEAVRCRERYPDAPCSGWGDNGENLAEFIGWCCRDAEKRYKDNPKALKAMLEVIEDGWVDSLRVYDLYIKTFSYSSGARKVCQPYMRRYEEIHTQ